jgi:malate dehydrogenase (oxaloacetate-decarboxylating)(NADP+)
MVEAGEVDAMVAGIEGNYGEILRPALHVVGPAEDAKRVAGLYMLAFPNRELLFFADTTVNIDPDAETLRDIALQTAAFVRELGIRPRVAMVSFSNFGSVKHSEARRVADAVDLIRAADPDLEIDGEMQADTAVDAIKLRDTYSFAHLEGPANVLIFPGLSAANAAYKLLDHLGGADVIGPVLLGMAKPVHILERGCSVQSVVNLATVASVDWQAGKDQI